MLSKRCPCADPTKCLHAWWYCFELRGRRYRASTKTANLRLAERFEIKAKNDFLEHANGTAAPKAWKFSTHIADYLVHTTQHNKTAYKDAKVLESLRMITGSAMLSEITPFHIERWKTSRAKLVSPSTVNREMNIVRGCFSTAVSWGRLSASPCAGVKNFDVDDIRVRVLSDDELRTFLKIEDAFVVLLCRATLESLGRLSEILNLYKAHIGPTWVEMRKKGGKVSRVPVTPELRTALLTRAHAVSGAIFGEGELGHPPTQQTATNRVLRALSAAGIPDASHHTMRHTGITLMLENGVNPLAIVKLAGWTSIRMLARYGHVRDAEAMRAVRGVSGYLLEMSTSDPTTATTEQRV